MNRAAWHKHTERLLWLVAAICALWVIADVSYTIAHRITYPYDLEWMEGGTLHHASRIARGNGIYVAPSVSFIPFLYTPFYPALVGLLGSVVGISYTLARSISVAALVITLFASWIHFRRYRLWREGIPLLADKPGSAAIATLRPTSLRPELWVATLVTMAVYATAYYYVEGWFDLARADSLFLCMVTTACYGFVREPEESPLPMRLVALTALLTLAFFCKQTGVIYVFVIGALMLVTTPRRMWVMVPIAAGIGIGGTWMLNGASSGWFWTYIFEIHQQHGFSWERVWQSFPNQLGVVPIASATLGLGAVWAICHVAVRAPKEAAGWLGVTAAITLLAWFIDARLVLLTGILAVLGGNVFMNRHAELGVRLFWRWLTIYSASLLVGAIGWGTSFAHHNAYMPALLHGAVTCGALVIAALQSAHSWKGRLVFVAATTTLCGVLALDHDPTKRLIPSAQNREAGATLVAAIKRVDGEVWVPSGPWYGKLAGKAPWVHRMGLIDVTAHETGARPYPVALLHESLRTQTFAAIVLFNRDIQLDPMMESLLYAYYKPTRLLAAEGAVPRLMSGADVVPVSIWEPVEVRSLPDGAIVLGDFESGTWKDWVTEGVAFGMAPTVRPPVGQSTVIGYGGRFFVSSMHQGDVATGKLWLRNILLSGTKLSFLLSGGVHPTTVRVELHIEDEVIYSASPSAAGETMKRVQWDIAPYQGQRATLVAIDDDTGGWGHLNIDDVMLLP